MIALFFLVDELYIFLYTKDDYKNCSMKYLNIKLSMIELWQFSVDQQNVKNPGPFPCLY